MRSSCLSAGLALALALTATPALAQDETDRSSDSAEAGDLESLMGSQVLVMRADGSEVPGTLLGVTDQSLTVVKADGRIISIRRADVERVIEAPAATTAPPPEPTPVAPRTPPKPDRPPMRPAEERVLVGAAYTGQYFDLFDTNGVANDYEAAFFGGRAYRYFLFVDQDGRRLSQANGWNLMGDPDAFRRLSGQRYLVPMQAASTAFVVAGLVAIPLVRNPTVSPVLLFTGLGLGISTGMLRPVFERKRGKLALEKAQQTYAGSQ